MLIDDQSDANWQPIWRQSDVNLIWTNLVPIEVKNTQLAEIQDRKGTPFEKFSEDLSTNEKPAFQALDQWEASISARFLFFDKPGVYQSNDNRTIERHFDATEVPSSNANGLSIKPIHYKSDTNRYPIWCQLQSNLIPIDCQWYTNWHRIWSQLIPNQMPINNQLTSNVPFNSLTIECQSKTNWNPIRCHWNQFWYQSDKIECQSTTN